MIATRTAATALLALLLFAALLIAPEMAASETPLFTEVRPLELELRVDQDALCRKAHRVDCKDTPAVLVHHAPDGSSTALSVRLRTRGEWRLDPSNCTYPPLFIIFGDDARGSLFEGQHLLPMTNQCRGRGGTYKDWVLREYLAYRMYQLLTDKSVRTRLARVGWTDPSGGHLSEPHWSFLAEHFRDMAERNDAELLDIDVLDLDNTDAMELATMELFQYMIGNVDWSALKLHNIQAIRNLAAPADSAVTAVPFDFDFSGLVAARYAGLPPGLPIRSTRQRLYRGFCHPSLDWDRLFANFLSIRPQVFELLDTLPDLSSSRRRATRRYLQDFFEIIESPGRRERHIINHCRSYVYSPHQSSRE